MFRELCSSFLDLLVPCLGGTQGWPVERYKGHIVLQKFKTTTRCQKKRELSLLASKSVVESLQAVQPKVRRVAVEHVGQAIPHLFGKAAGPIGRGRLKEVSFRYSRTAKRETTTDQTRSRLSRPSFTSSTSICSYNIPTLTMRGNTDAPA